MSPQHRWLWLWALLPLTVGAADRERLEAAQALLWSGQLAEAEAALLALHAEDPADVDVLLRLAQARRWSGRGSENRPLLQSALRLAPDRGELRLELAWLDVDEGRGRRAEALLAQGSVAPSPELQRRLDRLRRTQLSLELAAFEDSHRTFRLAPRLVAVLPLPHDVRLRLGGGASLVGQGEHAAQHPLLAAGAEVPLGPAGLTAGWALHPREEGALHEAYFGGQVRLRPGAALKLLGRRRPLVEPSLPTASGVDLFHQAGTGGALDLARVSRRGVDELVTAFAGSPGPGVYVYAEGRGFRVSDGNSGYAFAAGAGFNALSLVGVKTFDAVLRWDSWASGMRLQSREYFSPRFLDAHAPGLELRARVLPDALTLQLEGGPTFSFSTASGGYWGGGGLDAALGRVKLSVRLQARQEPWFNSRKAWAAAQVEL
jgi:hypothetical protein